jgi:hypothetical protein
MIRKTIGRRGGVTYICDPDRRGCGAKITPGQQRKIKKKKTGSS